MPGWGPPGPCGCCCFCCDGISRLLSSYLHVSVYCVAAVSLRAAVDLRLEALLDLSATMADRQVLTVTTVGHLDLLRFDKHFQDLPSSYQTSLYASFSICQDFVSIAQMR